MPFLEIPQVRVQCVQASSRTHYFDEMVKDPINVNNEGCHFRLFSERVNEWKQKREVGALKNVLLELGFRSDGGNLQHRILWLLPTNWQLKHESKSYFRNLQRGCTPAKLYLFVLWKIFNSQIREWSQSLQDAIFNSTWPSSSSPYTFSAITSTSLTLFIILIVLLTVHCIRTLSRGGIYWHLRSRQPRNFPRSESFVSLTVLRLISLW